MPERAGTSGLWLARLLQAKAYGAQSMASEFERLSLNDLSKLVVFLGCYSGKIRSEKRAVSYDRGPSEWSRIAAAGADVLCKWPEALGTYLDDLRARHGVENAMYLTGAFARFYTYATDCFNEPQFEFFLREFAKYINSRWPHREIRYRKTRLGRLVAESTGRIHGSDAARKLGVSRDQLIDLVKSGMLRGTVIKARSRTWVSVDSKSLERFKRTRIGCLSLKQARKRLGVSARVAAAMMDAGLLEIRGARKRAVRCVSESSVTKLLRSFETARAAGKCSRRNAVSLKWAMKHLPGGAQWVPELVKAVLAERARPKSGLAVGAGLSAFEFDRVTILKFAAREPTGERRFTFSEAARILRVRDEIMYKLADAGIVASVNSDGGRGARFVARAEIERIQALYVRASELGKSAGISASMARKRLKEAGVTPVFHRTGGNRGFYLFDRHAAECALKSGTGSKMVSS